VSTSGGITPLWARDGNALFYRDPRGAVTEVKAASQWPNHATPTTVVNGSYVAGSVRNFDVSPDNQRFLMLKDLMQSREADRIVIVPNGLR